jgi:hypothetical protein
MSIFTYHLFQLPLVQALIRTFCPLKIKNANGLIHSEIMSVMELGAPILSVSRFFSKTFVFFAQWETEEHFNVFLQSHRMGEYLAKGWIVKLRLIRKWGHLSGFDLRHCEEDTDSDASLVLAVTLAKMKPAEIPRFLRWGRPVEQLVRDHPGCSFSLASIRYPNLISTFSIWQNKREMIEMVRGHSDVAQPSRHIDAMKERNRKDFHFEFTTLRFRPIAEIGTWNNASMLKFTEPQNS